MNQPHTFYLFALLKYHPKFYKLNLVFVLQAQHFGVDFFFCKKYQKNCFQIYKRQIRGFDASGIH